MASLTQVLASSNAAPIEDINIAGNLNEGLKAGMNLATAKEQVEEKKIQVAQQKEQLEMGKINSFNGMIKTLNLAKPAIAKQMAPKLKERFQGMGFDPAIVDTIMADPDFGRALFNITNEHGSELSATPESRAKLLSAYQDIGLLSDGLNYIQDAKKQSIQNKFLKEQQGRQIQGQKDIAAISSERASAKTEAGVTKDAIQGSRLISNKLLEITKKDREGLSQLAEANNMLSTGEAIPQSAARRSLAKAYNSGALTDSDVNDFAGDKAIASRFIQALETGATGELTEDNVRQLLMIAKSASDRKMRNIEASAKDSARQISTLYPEYMDKNKAYNFLLPEEYIESNKFKEKAATPPVKSLEQAMKDAEAIAISRKQKFDPIKMKPILEAKGYK